jgi:hypothetical protein
MGDKTQQNFLNNRFPTQFQYLDQKHQRISNIEHVPLLAAGRSGKKDDRGERKCAESEATIGRKRSMQESVHEESDSWMEEHHTHMGGRPNIGRVRVLVMNCNG